eukprot:CAMPEP_0184989812 /NCGR_PEP_ID=MMETSP1098-20130426/30268_1 /TAXON_ID=89044 /ORGANISM="Spumella elongata, Strain CCAP 955/1" /LENGTH=366 /DNA_ID=CAMNT_0027514891 /DNA_START=65 /DNA_END=1165 /DNA_ORIENTATION=+
MSKFSENSFSVCILSALNGFVQEDLNRGVSFHYIVPENLCRKHHRAGKDGEAQFSSGAIMAAFDEISTYATIMQDKTHRPGLSLHLSTEIIKNVNAGDEVTFLTHADKLGKTLGFCSMEMLNSKGELVARGKHIRYLQMGFSFDLITKPWALPWALKFYETFYGKKTDAMATTGETAGKGEHIFRKPLHFPELDGLGRVFELLGLTKVDPTETAQALPAVRSAEDSLLYCSEDGRADPAQVAVYGLTVRPIVCNMLGSMHGGAVACAVEQACLLSRARNTNQKGELSGPAGVYETDCFVSSVEVRYISAMKGDLQITCAEDIHSPLLPADSQDKQWHSKSFGKVLSKKDGSMCAEYVCHWAMQPTA